MALIPAALRALPQRANGVTGMSAREIVRRIGALNLLRSSNVARTYEAVDAKKAKRADAPPRTSSTARVKLQRVSIRHWRVAEAGSGLLTIKECFPILRALPLRSVCPRRSILSKVRTIAAYGLQVRSQLPDQRTAAYDLYGN